MTIKIRKVKEEYGCLSNMHNTPITWNGQEWRTSEALFQALRFSDIEIREHIRSQKSPMGAKLAAKSRQNQMTIKPLSNQDVLHMEFCLRLKFTQNEKAKQILLSTGKQYIVEDCTKRPRGSALFWGAKMTQDGWVGENKLGKLLMAIRAWLATTTE